MAKEEDDDIREAAIASTRPLQPNCKPKGVTEDQLAKFQELHRRRLQLKSKTKFDKKSKGIAHGFRKSHEKKQSSKDHSDTELISITKIEDSIPPYPRSPNNKCSSSVQNDNIEPHVAPPKRQKLHWGLDTKERWERKANM